jgi:hypothetical protein
MVNMALNSRQHDMISLKKWMESATCGKKTPKGLQMNGLVDQFECQGVCGTAGSRKVSTFGS